MPWIPLIALSLLALGISLGLALGPLEGIPHVSDEQAYLLQARVFAEGRRFAPTPVDGVAIVNLYQRLTPGWHGLFPPGWPGVLALGVLAGAPALVNPLLTAALPPLAWWALSPHLPRRAALLAAGLLALSPGTLALGASFMSHPLALACGLTATGAALAPALRPRAAAIGGLALGLLALTRPYDAALVGLPLCLHVAWRARAEGPAAALAFAAGPALALALTAGDNHALTGSWSTFPMQDYHARPTDWGMVWPPGCDALGFGEDRGCFGPRGHQPDDALASIAANGRIYDRLFMGFTGSSIAALAGLPLLARRRGLLALPALSVPLGYSLYWYEGVVFGARFWSSASLAAAPAAALALDALWTRLEGLRAGWVAPALPALGLATTLPLLAAELGEGYWCAEADRLNALADAGVSEGVVLVLDLGERAARWPLTTLPEADRCTPALSQGAALGWNDPFGRAPLTWIEGAEPLPEAARAAAARHPGEPVYTLVRDLGGGAWRLLRWSAEAGALVEVARGP